VQADPNLTYTNNYGSMNEITYNPVACTDTASSNPFSNAKIRERPLAVRPQLRHPGRSWVGWRS